MCDKFQPTNKLHRNDLEDYDFDFGSSSNSNYNDDMSTVILLDDIPTMPVSYTIISVNTI